MLYNVCKLRMIFKLLPFYFDYLHTLFLLVTHNIFFLNLEFFRSKFDINILTLFLAMNIKINLFLLELTE